jgi:hypothetical protein
MKKRRSQASATRTAVFVPGSHSLRCESKLPEGTVPHVPPPAASRIAIGGAFLDEVRIRQTGATLLSFPASNHRAQVASDGVVTIHAQALTVAQLFADCAFRSNVTARFAPS